MVEIRSRVTDSGGNVDKNFPANIEIKVIS